MTSSDADRDGRDRAPGDDDGRAVGEGGRGRGDEGDAAAIDPAELGEIDAPPVAEKPYKVVFEANACFGAGQCATVSSNWSLDVDTGIARPLTYFFDENDLEGNVRAAEVCPAKKGAGVIHVIDRRTGEELAPDPYDDGTLSVDW